MKLLNVNALRPLLTSLALSALFTPLLPAQELYVGSLDTQFKKGDPVAGNFQLLGACGGQIQSMVESYQDVYLGDVGGRIYKYFGHPSHQNSGQTTYLFDSANDATALADYGGTLLVGGSDATVLMIDKQDGSLENTYNVIAPVGAMLVIDGELYLGSSNTLIWRVNLQTGASTVLGACGGQIQSMTRDGDHLVLGTPNNTIYRMELATGVVDAVFAVSNDATALVMHAGDLLVGGSDSSILRVHPVTGAVLATMASTTSSVSALAISPAITAPGLPFCFGLGCPCGNDDVLAGCGNSTGPGAGVHGSGSDSFLSDDLVLTVDHMPTNSWAVMYMGALPNNISFGDGKLCTGAGYPLYRFPIQNTGAAGTITVGPGVVDYSHQNFDALGQIQLGNTWMWQIWYRNPGGPCGAGFNTSNAYAVNFGV